MLQYLLNATSIWLISLVLFDIFLRRESYHSYNRFYLLFTFLLGALLPLWQWQDDSLVLYTPLEKPLQQVITVKETFVTVAGAPSAKINWEIYLGYIYLAGVMVTFLLLIAEVVKIIRLYRSGKRLREGSCVIIETAKNYSPFSLFNYVFVNSKDQYTAEEWNILIAHEQLHGLLFHFIDVLLVQIARIVFWFHPLTYAYQKKLMMLHEYQADKVSAAKPQFYGHFLVGQALLQVAPSISHSFNRSPVKNRIVMLTYKSSAAAKIKMLVFIPLALVCIICFSKNTFSQKFEKNGNIVTYRGNKFELSDPIYDTMVLIDPVDGHQITKVTEKNPEPVKMNETKIYNTDEVTEQPTTYAENGPLADYIFKGLSNELNKLPDGNYYLHIDNIVVDNKGKIVYYDYGGLLPWNNEIKIPADIKKVIDKKVDALINNAPAFSPGKVGNSTVIVRTDIYLSRYKISVLNHKTTIAGK